MKYLNLLIRVILVGIVWTLFYVVVGRALIYAIWGFDPLYVRHWNFFWQMWKDGWIIDTPMEWTFLSVIVFFIPVWLLGWLLLSGIKWGTKLWNGIKIPILFLGHAYDDKVKVKTLVITKRKSYRRIRPNPLPYFVPDSDAKAKPHKSSSKRKDGKDSAKMYEKIGELSGQTKNKKLRDAEYMPDEDDFADIKAGDTGAVENKVEEDTVAKTESAGMIKKLRQVFESSDDNGIDGDARRFEEPPMWNLSVEQDEKSTELSAEEEAALKLKVYEDSRDMLKAKGFKVLENVSIDGVKVDFVGLSANSVLLCKLDDAKGDWLADEDAVNGELPKWFCEDKHRDSPVALLDNANKKFKEMSGVDDTVDVRNILIIEDGDVINAPDMKDVWDEKNVTICRMGLGEPVSLPHFIEILTQADGPATKSFVEKCKKALKVK